MVYPEFIKCGNDTIAVTAPSDGNSSEEDYRRLDMAVKNIEDRGVHVTLTANVKTSDKGRSSDGKSRAEQFMSVWENENVSAVISAKGGDFLMEMLPYVDYDRVATSHKWFQGYSDNTGLTFTITTIADIATIYCNNFNDYAMKNWHRSIVGNWDILCGKKIVQTSFDKYQNGFFEGENGDEDYNLTEEVCWKLVSSHENDSDNVKLEGRLLGGCLDVLLNLVGTRFDKVRDFCNKYKNDGILWYLESFSLGSEAIERGLWQLNEAGWFDNARGFVFGRPAFFDSFTDTSYEEAVMNALAKLNVPVIINADIGHKPPQLTMINGALCNIEYDGKSYKVYYNYK